MTKYYSKIHVQRKRDGSKASSVRVSLGFTGLLGGFTKSFYTDRHGVALVEHASRGEAKVYANGKHVATMRAPGETVVFV